MPIHTHLEVLRVWGSWGANCTCGSHSTVSTRLLGFVSGAVPCRDGWAIRGDSGIIAHQDLSCSETVADFPPIRPCRVSCQLSRDHGGHSGLEHCYMGWETPGKNDFQTGLLSHKDSRTIWGLTITTIRTCHQGSSTGKWCSREKAAWARAHPLQQPRGPDAHWQA